MITAKTIHTVIETILELDSGTIKGDESLEQIYWDSLAVIAFIATMDSAHGIAIPVAQLQKASNVSDLVDLVQKIEAQK
jgi:acyl carrier protein